MYWCTQSTNKMIMMINIVMLVHKPCLLRKGSCPSSVNHSQQPKMDGSSTASLKMHPVISV